MNGMIQSLFFLMKKPYYNIIIISTFSGLTVPEGYKGEKRMGNGDLVKFKYPVIVDDHYRYRGSVSNHILLRHDGGTKSQIGLDSAWEKTCWPIQCFAFFNIIY